MQSDYEAIVFFIQMIFTAAKSCDDLNTKQKVQIYMKIGVFALSATFWPFCAFRSERSLTQFFFSLSALFSVAASSIVSTRK